MFDSAGWSVHLGLTRDDPSIGGTLEVLRADGRLPPDGRRSPPRAGSGPQPTDRDALARPPAAVTVEGWLDDMATDEGALVFADSPATYSIISRMSNPRLARVFGVHLSHLSAAATRLGDPMSIANGPLTVRWGDVSDATVRAADRIVVLTETQRRDFQLRWGADLPVDVIPHYASPVDREPDRDFDKRLVVGLGQLRKMKCWMTRSASWPGSLRRFPARAS